MEQNSSGCDYTIGCGALVLFIEADSREEAIRIMNKKWWMEDYMNGESDPSYYINGERALKLWSIIEFEKAWDLLPMLHEWNDKMRAEEAAAKQAKQDATDRAKYEELKRKFG